MPSHVKKKKKFQTITSLSLSLTSCTLALYPLINLQMISPDIVPISLKLSIFRGQITLYVLGVCNHLCFQSLICHPFPILDMCPG